MRVATKWVSGKKKKKKVGVERKNAWKKKWYWKKKHKIILVRQKKGILFYSLVFCGK